MGLFGDHVQDTCRGIVTCRLHEVFLFTDGHADRLYIIQGIPADIYLSGLGVGDRHAVVAHGRMMGTEISHTHGLHATDTSVVFHIRAGKALYGICQIGEAQLLQLFFLHQLYRATREHIPVYTMPPHGDRIQLLFPLHTLILLCMSAQGGGNQKDEKY